jgi:hypothetical protein
MPDTPQTKSNTYCWKTPNSKDSVENDITWIEVERTFKSIQCNGTTYSLDEIDLEELRPKRPRGQCGTPEQPCDNIDCTKMFPSGFKVCPDYGQELVPMLVPIPDASETLWSFPGGAGDGLLNVESVEIKDTGEKDDYSMCAPEGSDLSFVVAGKPRRLFAIDRNNSNVFVFDRVRMSWRTLTPHHDFDSEIPQWALAVSAFDAGFIVPGVRGPLIIGLEKFGTALAITEVRPLPGPLVGCPGILKEHASSVAHCLVRSGNAIAHLCYDTKSGRWEQPAAIDGMPAGVGVDDYFSAPVCRSEQRMLFWCGKKGYVALRCLDGGKREIKWRSWKADFVPELRIRPLWANNAIWQFGFAPDGQPLFHELKRAGEAAVNSVDATHLTAGEYSFTCGMQVYSTPWQESSSRKVCNTDSLSFYMPICGLKGRSALVADCSMDQNRVDPWELLRDEAEAKPARLLIYRENGGPIDLKHTVQLARIDQLHPIVFDGHLIMYDRLSNGFTRWKLK